MELSKISFILCEIKKPYTHIIHIHTNCSCIWELCNSEEMILKITKIPELYNLCDLKLNFTIIGLYWNTW